MYESNEESSQEVSSEEDSSEGTQRKKPTRKRKKRPDVWQKNKRKRQRNSGKKYVSTSKKVASGNNLLGSTGLCNTHHHACINVPDTSYEPCCTIIPFRSHQSVQLGHLAAANSNVSLLHLIIQGSLSSMDSGAV